VDDPVAHRIAVLEIVDCARLVAFDQVQLQAGRAGVDDEDALGTHTSGMRVLEVCAIVVAAGLPWIVGIAYYWRRMPKDGAVAHSFGEYLRQRTTVR
jgi:hypothetical protein